MNTRLVGCCIRLYSLVFDLARRFVLPFLAGLGRRKGWDIDRRQILPRVIRERRGGARTMAWVHAASLGEAKLLAQFLGMLEARNPDDCYVVTATTRSGVEYLERMKRPSIAAAGFLPLDTLPLMRALIRRFSVSRVWLLETELWPSMLWACHTAGIPVGMANARMEEKSFVNYRRFAPLVRMLLQQLDVVMAQNETYAQRFIALGVRPENLHVVGNMKGYIRIQRPDGAERLQLRRRMNLSGDEKVITAGCVHKGEGTVLRACLDELNRRGRACKFVVVPRYLEESAAIAEELGAGVLRLSENATAGTWECCIVEKLGVLETMYRIADAAVVGGTFVEVGGHNVWEPAKFGIPVFFGPSRYEQNTSCEKLLVSGVGFHAADGRDLASGIERVIWTDPRKFLSAETLFTEHINRQQSVVEPLIP
jgi:3-deoxy-D-manno-octulosonic-acid transferase